MQHLFKQITRFNQAFGNEPGDMSRLDSQLDLFNEERTELEIELGKINQDQSATRKEACDLIVVTAGLLDIVKPDWSEDLTISASFCSFPTGVIRSLISTALTLKSPANKARCLTDIINVCFAEILRAGGDVERDMAIVNESNLSKFCSSDEEIQQTAKMYDELGVRTSIRCLDGELVSFVSIEDQEGSNGKKYSKGKLLKPANYVPVIL